MSAHTPGPWIVDEDDPLCVGTPKSWYPKQVYDVVTVLEGGDEYTAKANRKAEANARLIAAAPDLLEALKAIIAERDRFLIPDQENAPAGTLDYLYNNGRAAIAKAEGK